MGASIFKNHTVHIYLFINHLKYNLYIVFDIPIKKNVLLKQNN